MNRHFAWAAISVYPFRNFCHLRQRYFHAQNNRLINPRCLEPQETLTEQRISATALSESRHLISVVKQAVPATFMTAYTTDSLRNS